ncbi:MAG: TIM barrel protein [Geminicoccaceae bacterium]|nr:TIM barrel protein [Geminicoccaceae bacterium]
MARYSANLGFLWTELSLVEGVRAAKKAGFDAVECHWPYATPAAELGAVLKETGLPMLGLNTVRGDAGKGEFGLAALEGREREAIAAIEQAIDYAAAAGVPNVHVMAGKKGRPETFLVNLAHAADRAAPLGIDVLIEPINQRDAPGYTVSLVEEAAHLIDELGRSNVKIMFDCYHTQIMQGDLIRRIEKHLPLIGHIQIAAAPSRREPDEGEVALDRVCRAIDELGWQGWIGAEYRPRGTTEEGLGWLGAFRAAGA